MNDSRSKENPDLRDVFRESETSSFHCIVVKMEEAAPSSRHNDDHDDGGGDDGHDRNFDPNDVLVSF